MIEISSKELEKIIGGDITITGTLLNAFARGIDSILEVGRSLGTAIRRVIYDEKC